MVVTKRVDFGVGGAVLAWVLWSGAMFAIQPILPYVIARLRGTGGMSSAYVASDSILIAALIGFIIAFALAAFALAWYRLRAAS